MTTNTQITTIADILSATKGSPMERIIHYLVYQDFPEFSEKIDLAPGSKAISSLTLAEKAIFATRAELAIKANELINAHNKIGAELTPENFELAREKISKLNDEIETFRKICEDLYSMLAISIQHRLDNEGISYTGDLSVDSNFLVISSPKEEDEDDFFGGMGPLGMLFGDSGFSVEAHNCETCPVYDDCPLPQKKPR
jgi:hypothetical protein